MVASMIGLGPHEMTPWLWAFSGGLTASLALLAALTFAIALRASSRAGRRGR